MSSMLGPWLFRVFLKSMLSSSITNLSVQFAVDTSLASSLLSAFVVKILIAYCASFCSCLKFFLIPKLVIILPFLTLSIKSICSNLLLLNAAVCTFLDYVAGAISKNCLFFMNSPLKKFLHVFSVNLLCEDFHES
jgi:hypothetical protein